MRQRKTIFLQYLLSLLLVTCLTAGCVTPARPQAFVPLVRESAVQESTQSCEQYEKKIIDAQAPFDQLASDLFLDEVDNSPITFHCTLANSAAYDITDYDKTLGTVSLEDSKQVLNDAKSLKVQLNDIDSRLLRGDQLLTYNILSSYLNTMLDSEGPELYDQPLSFSLGIQAQLPILLSEYVLYSKQDVEDYLSLLSSINTYYDSIIAFEKEKTNVGSGPCDTVIDRILNSCNAYLLGADHSFMVETFAERLERVGGLTKREKEDFTARNHTAIDEHFVPTYQKLIEGLTPPKDTGTSDKGLHYLPQGKKYHQYLVNAYTGTSYQGIPALKKAMSDQMMDDLTAMDELSTENPTLVKKLYSCSLALTDSNQILEDLEKQCAKDFPAIEDYTCSTKNVPVVLEATLSPAFYLTASIDRPQDNSIYINNGSTNIARNLYSILTHEGYPGHMYQTLYFSKRSTYNLHKLLSFSSYSEGRAIYMEYYSHSLNNGLDSNLGELLQRNTVLILALYATPDVNIHYEGWGIKQVEGYLNHYLRISDSSVTTTIYYNIAKNPANYLECYVGYLEILGMQREAKKTLGSRYTDMEFNRFLLDIGLAPFSVIKSYFAEWLARQGEAGGRNTENRD